MKLRRRVMLTELPINALMTINTNPEVLVICYAQGWCASPNYMTYAEAAAITDIGTAFKGKTLKHFNEFLHFTGITSIPNNAFNGTVLKEMILPPNITSIGSTAFYNCDLLNCSNFIIPEGVVSIGFLAFRDVKCSKLTIPSTATSINGDAYAYTFTSTTLTTLRWNSPKHPYEGHLYADRINYISKYESDVYTVVDDMLLSDNGTTLFAVPPKKSNAYIPLGVTNIAPNACRSNITNPMELIEGIVTIRTAGFYYCAVGEYFVLPDSVLVIEGDSFRFTNCRKTYVSANTGTWTSGLQFSNIGDGHHIIVINRTTPPSGGSMYTFTTTASWPWHIYVPVGCTRNYTRNTWVALTDNSYTDKVIREIPDWFDTTSKATKLLGLVRLEQMENKIIKCTFNIVTIGQKTVCNNYDGYLSEETFFDGVYMKLLDSQDLVNELFIYNFTSTGEHNVYVFGNAIEEDVFSGVQELRSISLSGGITEIPQNAFYNCKDLISATIPSTVTTIGANAFYGCTTLVGVASIANLTTVGNDAFEGCYFLNAAVRNSVGTINPNALGNYNTITLPNGYTLLSYITADRDSYIDTGITPSGTICFDTTVYNLQPSMHIMGGKVSDSSGLYRITIDSSNKIYYFVMGNNTSNNYALTAGNNYRIRAIKGSLYTDDTYRTLRTATFNGTLNLYLFALNTNGVLTLSTNIPTLGRTIIAKDNVILRDYIPCTTNTDIKAMYDLINGTTHYLEDLDIVGSIEITEDNMHNAYIILVNMGLLGQKGPRPPVVYEDLSLIFEKIYCDNEELDLSTLANASGILGNATQVSVGVHTIRFKLVNKTSFTIDTDRFYPTSMSDFIIPKSVVDIGQEAFGFNKSIKTITLKNTVPPTVAANSFDTSAGYVIYVPLGTIDTYLNTSNWNNFRSIMEEIS